MAVALTLVIASAVVWGTSAQMWGGGFSGSTPTRDTSDQYVVVTTYNTVECTKGSELDLKAYNFEEYRGTFLAMSGVVDTPGRCAYTGMAMDPTLGLNTLSITLEWQDEGCVITRFTDRDCTDPVEEGSEEFEMGNRYWDAMCVTGMFASETRYCSSGRFPPEVVYLPGEAPREVREEQTAATDPSDGGTGEDEGEDEGTAEPASEPPAEDGDQPECLRECYEAAVAMTGGPPSPMFCGAVMWCDVSECETATIDDHWAYIHRGCLDADSTPPKCVDSCFRYSWALKQGQMPETCVFYAACELDACDRETKQEIHTFVATGCGQKGLNRYQMYPHPFERCVRDCLTHAARLHGGTADPFWCTSARKLCDTDYCDEAATQRYAEFLDAGCPAPEWKDTDTDDSDTDDVAVVSGVFGPTAAPPRAPTEPIYMPGEWGDTDSDHVHKHLDLKYDGSVTESQSVTQSTTQSKQIEESGGQGKNRKTNSDSSSKYTYTANISPYVPSASAACKLSCCSWFALTGLATLSIILRL